jgi:hypothetical protein
MFPVVLWIIFMANRQEDYIPKLVPIEQKLKPCSLNLNGWIVHCVNKLIEITLSIIVHTRIIQSYLVSVSNCPCNCICSLITKYWLQNCTSDSFSKKDKPRKLVSLCLGTLGQHLEDIISDISEFAALFPPHIKVSLCIYVFCLVVNLCIIASLPEQNVHILYKIFDC